MAKVTAKKKAAASKTKTTANTKSKADSPDKAGESENAVTKKTAKKSSAAKKAPATKKKVESKSKSATKKAAAKKSDSKKATSKSVTKKKTVTKATTDAATEDSANKPAKKAESKTTTGAKKASATAKKKTTGKKATSKKAAAKKSTAKAKAADSTEPENKMSQTAAEPVADDDDDGTDPGTDGFPSSSRPVVRYEKNKGGDYMNEEHVAYFRKILAEWKQQLMEEVDRTVGHMKDDATNFPDPNDRATQEEEFSLELRTRDRERKLIKKINEAQKRIDDEEYGYCETCGIEIGFERLQARPTAELCFDCKTLEEIRERQIA